MNILIGIDDTDNDASPGTGRLARLLADELIERGAAHRGITRHQFLMHPSIPFTSHNSGACIEIEWNRPIAQLSFAADLIQTWAAPGSDPGFCMAAAESVPPPIVAWGWAATKKVLTMQDAIHIAAISGVQLRALGGTGQGIIGALASVGLRADGNEGRFLDLPGLRALNENVPASELQNLNIIVEHHGNGDGTIYKTLNWVRPRLAKGRPVWPVEWSDEHHAWIPIDRKKDRPLE